MVYEFVHRKMVKYETLKNAYEYSNQGKLNVLEQQDMLEISQKEF